MRRTLNPTRSLRELLSAAAVDSTLRSRLKAHASSVLRDWGIKAPGRTVYFVEPGEAPAAGLKGDAFVELPAAAPELADPDLEAVAGGWDQARDRAVAAVDVAVGAVAWHATDPWS